jgi:hypothetical protein
VVASVEASKAPHCCKFDVQGRQASFRASVLVREERAGTISALPAQSAESGSLMLTSMGACAGGAAPRPVPLQATPYGWC